MTKKISNSVADLSQQDQDYLQSHVDKTDNAYGHKGSNQHLFHSSSPSTEKELSQREQDYLDAYETRKRYNNCAFQTNSLPATIILAAMLNHTEYEEKYVYPCESEFALYSALVSLTGFFANAFTPAFILLSRPTFSSDSILMSLSSGSLTIVITS